MERRFNALLVGASEETVTRFEEVLDDWGWDTTTCPGPALGKCPLMSGRHCELRDAADTAVVFVDTAHVNSTGVLPKLRCAGDHSSPYVLALEGKLTQPEERIGGSVIGARRGEEAIAYEVVKRHAPPKS